jgi:hypothetical protein
MARHTTTSAAIVSRFVRQVAEEDRAAALAFFLMEQGKPVTGRWTGRISAADQRALFGMLIGKGRISVDGARETVEMTVSVCFGTDFSTEFLQPWYALDAGELSRDLYGLGHIAQPYRYGKAEAA